jgi:heme-degrading monooxygenase HmoA
MITVFRSRRRPGTEDAYALLAGQMEVAARAMPGFVDFKTFRADDGEQVSVVTFESAEAQRAWREDPRHVAAQRRGREELYLDFSIQVGRCEHVTRFTADPG